MLIALLILTVALSAIVPQARLVAGALTLVSAAVGSIMLDRAQRVISLTLVLVGLTTLVIAIAIGHGATIGELLMLNQDLIAMLAAVSFVQLIVSYEATTTSRLSGRAAVWRTATALHLLGSVINMSALNIVGEHLARGGRLTRLNELLLSRSYSAAAFWSPFWGAAAAVIAYAPGAKVNVLAVCGASMAAVALIYSIGGLVGTFRTELSGYHGYALSWRALRVPLVLVIIVLVAHGLAPEMIIPHVVLISSVAMTLTVLFIRQPWVAHKLIIDHAGLVLPRLKGEAALFASAGALAVGLSALFDALELDLPISDFNVLTAWLCTLVMALMSLVGVHPVISIAAVAALIAPLDPDPTLYAMAGMLAWGASAAAGPISGLNIFLNGRFGTNNFAIARANLPYLFVVLLLAGPVLLLCSLLV